MLKRTNGLGDTHCLAILQVSAFTQICIAINPNISGNIFCLQKGIALEILPRSLITTVIVRQTSGLKRALVCIYNGIAHNNNKKDNPTSILIIFKLNVT